MNNSHQPNNPGTNNPYNLQEDETPYLQNWLYHPYLSQEEHEQYISNTVPVQYDNPPATTIPSTLDISYAARHGNANNVINVEKPYEGNLDSKRIPAETSELQKKRESTAKREQERRLRLNHYFEQIKASLPDEIRNNDKMTKEQILVECLEYIKSLQSKLSHTTQISTLPDPSTTKAPTQQEVDRAFVVFYAVEFQSSLKISSREDLQIRFARYSKLIEFAEMSSQVEHKLAAHNFCQYNYATLFCIPSKLFPVLDKTYDLYHAAKRKEKLDKTWLSFGNVNIKTMVLANYAVAYALVGNMDASKEYWERAVLRARKKKHLTSEQYVIIQLIILNFISGASLSVEEAISIRDMLSTNKHFADLGFLAYSYALIRNSTNPSEHSELIPAMLTSANNFMATHGSYGEVFSQGIFIACLVIINPAKSLSEIDAMIEKLSKTGITNLWNLGDFYRMKAEALMRIFSATMPLKVTSEIALLLEMSIKAAEEAELVVSVIKSLTLLVQLNLEEERLNSYKSKMQNLYILLATYCVNNTPMFLKEAQQFVNM